MSSALQKATLSNATATRQPLSNSEIVGASQSSSKSCSPSLPSRPCQHCGSRARRGELQLLGASPSRLADVRSCGNSSWPSRKRRPKTHVASSSSSSSGGALASPLLQVSDLGSEQQAGMTCHLYTHEMCQRQPGLDQRSLRNPSPEPRGRN